MITGILYVFIGLLAGLSSGLLGIGGSVVMIPLLVFFFKTPQIVAQGIALTVLLVPIGVFAGWWHYFKEGHINLLASTFILIGFILGAYFGGQWAVQLPITLLKKGFALFLVCVAAKLFFS